MADKNKKTWNDVKLREDQNQKLSFTDEFIETLKARSEDFLKADNDNYQSHKDKLFCVWHDDKGNPNLSLNKKNNSLKCFSCNKSGNIIQYAQAKYNLDFVEAVKFVANVLGFSINGATTTTRTDYKLAKKEEIDYNIYQPPTLKDLTEAKAIAENGLKGFKLALDEYKKNRYDTHNPIYYLSNRGFTLEFLAENYVKFGLGYSYKHNTLTLPTSYDNKAFKFTGATYRLAKKELAENELRIKKAKDLNAGIFNLSAFYQTEKPVVLVEGELDALSLSQVAGDNLESVALSSTGNTKLIEKIFKNRPPEADIFIDLDNDNAGKTAEQDLISIFSQLNIKHAKIELLEGIRNDKGEEVNDHNEALQVNSKKLTENIEMFVIKYHKNKEEFFTEFYKHQEQKQKEEQKMEIDKIENKDNSINSQETKTDLNTKQDFNPNDVLISETGNGLDYVNLMEETAEKHYISTGFDSLDYELSGGIDNGLYFLGATPGAGKTAIFTQLADNLIDQNIDVIFFSLEMERHDLGFRRASRLIKQKLLNDGYDSNIENFSMSSFSIKNCYRKNDKYNSKKFNSLSAEDLKALEEKRKLLAMNSLEAISSNDQQTFLNSDINKLTTDIIEFNKQRKGDLFIIDPERLLDKEQRFTINVLKTIIGHHTLKSGKKPVIFLDFLQLISRNDDQKRQDTRTFTDDNLTELKDIARGLGVTIFIVSAINRDSYNKINISSFKESGAIEYAGQVILGMSFDDEHPGNTKKEYKEDKDGNLKKNDFKTYFDVDQAREQNPKHLQVQILKNRQGQEGKKIKFDFYGDGMLFVETDKDNYQPEVKESEFI